MAVQIEIWRSAAGTDPGDFSLIATVADGSTTSYLDYPLTAGQLYIYKARRHDTGTGTYSAFSPLLYLAGAYPPFGVPLMLNVNTNVNPNFVTQAGLVIDPGNGQASKVSRLLSLDSFDPGKSGLKRIDRTDWNGGPWVTGEVKGEGSYALKLGINATPECYDELLCLYFGAPTTSSVAAPSAPAAPTVTPTGTAGSTTYNYKIVARSPQGDSALSSAGTTTTGNATLSGTNYNAISWSPVQGATQYVVINSGTSTIVGITQALSFNDTGASLGSYSAPSSPTGNQQVYKNSSAILTGTLALYYGVNGAGSPLARFYPGCVGDKLTIKFDKKSNTPFRLDADLMALYEVDGFSTSAVGLSSAVYDSLSPFSEAFSVISIAGQIAPTEGMSIAVDNNLGTVHNATGYAGPIGYYKQGAKHKITSTLYFGSDAEKQRFFGQVNQNGFYAEKQNLLTFPIQCVVANPVNGGGIVNEFSVYCGTATYQTMGEPIKGKDGCVMQDVEITPLYDSTTGTDIVITNVDSRTNSSIISTGTLITGFNGGGVNPWSN